MTDAVTGVEIDAICKVIAWLIVIYKATVKKKNLLKNWC